MQGFGWNGVWVDGFGSIPERKILADNLKQHIPTHVKKIVFMTCIMQGASIATCQWQQVLRLLVVCFGAKKVRCRSELHTCSAARKQAPNISLHTHVIVRNQRLVL